MTGAPVAPTSQLTDSTFPALHGRPPRGWLNDPNGCACIDGVWHVFYQYNPDAPVHERTCWGHMSSTDLVHWRTEPVALRPRPGQIDAAGCWSGCLVVDHGIPTLVYSAIADHSGSSVVALARADRQLHTFMQARTPAIGMPGDSSITDVRDPYVFELGGRRYAVQGAGSRDGMGGSVLLYECDDLSNWTELGTLLRSDHPVAAQVAGADVWECPNLVRLGDRWVLVVSILRTRGNGPRTSHAAWILGDVIETADGPAFSPLRAGRLDDGPAFYAPQLISVNGRVLMWGWSAELGRSPAKVAAAGWAGVLTFPRELELRDDRVVVRPARELAALIAEPLAPAGPLPSTFTVTAPPTARLSLQLAGRPLWPAGMTVTQVYVDGSLIEAFTVDDASFTTRGYLAPSQSFSLVGHGPGIAVRALRP